MQEVYTFLIGILILLSAVVFGEILARITKEELKDGKKYFKILLVISLVFSIIFLLFRKDDLFFTMLFIAIVSSKSLFYRDKNKKVKLKQRKIRK